MRFTVGQQVLFIGIEENPTPDEELFMSIYRPSVDIVGRISVEVMRCQEHHSVGVGCSKILDHDGFVFTSRTGERWLNQYPWYRLDIDGAEDHQLRKEENGRGSGEMVTLANYLDRILSRLGELNTESTDQQRLTISLQTHFNQVVKFVADTLGYKVEFPESKKYPGDYRAVIEPIPASEHTVAITKALGLMVMDRPQEQWFGNFSK